MSHAAAVSHDASHDGPPMAHGTVLNTGITNGKIAIWLFLASEVMFFTGLIGAYIILRSAQDTWADPKEADYPLNIGLTAFNTFVLICSSVTLVYSLQSIQQGKRTKGNLGLLVTTLLGAFFVSVQAVEYHALATERNMTPGKDLFSSCFYAMTGFHGFHVFVGVVALAILTLMGFAGKFGPKKYAAVEMAGLYWHFVDLVWIILFAIVYLI